MSEILLWLHPLMQIFAALLGVWALYQGIQRIRMNRGVKLIFPWKQHVKLGTYALALWLLGALGFYVTHDLFGETHITGTHAVLAWPVMALALFGLLTGFIMDKHKKRRSVLPWVHGIANIVLIILVAVLCYTGIELWDTFGA